METDANKALGVSLQNAVASAVIMGHQIIPRLAELQVYHVDAQPNTKTDVTLAHSCKGHVNSAWETISNFGKPPCSAIGSLTTLRVSFIPESDANLVRIVGYSKFFNT
jgi:hypothetical protein